MRPGRPIPFLLQEGGPDHELTGIAGVTQPLIEESNPIADIFGEVHERFGVLVRLEHLAGLVHILVIESEDVQPVVLQLPEKHAQHVGFQIVIRIDELDIRTGSGGDAGIPGAAEAAVPLMDDADIAVLRCKGVAKCAGAIGGTVIDQDNLVILPGQILFRNASTL